MAITFDCRCGRLISAPETAAGLRTHCPTCGVAMQVPAARERRPDPTDTPTWRLLKTRAKSQIQRPPGRDPGR